ncbi:GT-D fold domain-containing protein [Chelatococcus reniformis]|uniref:GT-D fold-like domain-containing protein n=1 Tax=Chelatococcus reniformis TaxID=1494448 RepID=A0A916TX39_9HYPH|nr:hypothetical protein [Chelatococcus reniformis]GGC48708.1 hypothetical protein GCM10010994_04870 [Chelatococcus reniformis]
MPNDDALKFERTAGLVAPSSVEQIVRSAIERKDAFSLIRCGDGESVVLGYPEFVHDTRFMGWMRNFFGPHADRPEVFRSLREWLEWAVSCADVVGTFREQIGDIERARQAALGLGALRVLTDDQKVEINGIEWRLLDHLTRPLILEQCLRTTSNIHIKMEESGLLKSIAAEADRLNVITGNDIKEKLEAAFPTTRIVQYRVPTEYKFEPVRDSWNDAEPHFPDVFNRIMDLIEQGDFEGVTFVGAGPCGKIYASAIKKAGGIALDIGSIMDVWAGRDTRSFMRTIRPGTFASGVQADARPPARSSHGDLPDPSRLGRGQRARY